MLHEYLPIYMKLCKKTFAAVGKEPQYLYDAAKWYQNLLHILHECYRDYVSKILLPSQHAQRGATHQTHAGSPSG
jgi:hypothetical protein